MPKITLSDVGNFNSSALSTLIANNDAIETAFDNTLSRDGSTPNQMLADIDLNGNDLLNVNSIQTDLIILDGTPWSPEDTQEDREAAEAAQIAAELAATQSAASAAAANLSASNITTWAPIFSIVSDIDRLVLYVVDWVGGSGDKPTALVYLGATGYVSEAADAVDIRGSVGAAGAAATISIGTVTTGAAGSSVIVTNVGTSTAAIFDITIPRGATGAAGAGTGDMLASSYDPTAKGVDVFNMDNMDEGATNKILTASERTTIADAAVKSSANTFLATQTYNTTVSGTTTQRNETVNGAATNGGRVDVVLKNTTPAPGHVLGAFRFLGDDSLGNEIPYANIRGDIINATDGATAGAFVMSARVADVQTIGLRLSNGVYIGEATGAYQGTGTINTTGYYLNGSLLSSTLFGITVGSTGLAILQDTSGAAVRTEIGAASTGANTFTGAQVVTTVALTDGATITPDLSLSNDFTLTIGGNRTLANPSNRTVGQWFSVTVTQDGTGTRTLSYGSHYKFPGGVAPTLTTTANAYDTLTFRVKSATEVQLVGIGKAFA